MAAMRPYLVVSVCVEGDEKPIPLVNGKGEEMQGESISVNALLHNMTHSLASKSAEVAMATMFTGEIELLPKKRNTPFILCAKNLFVSEKVVPMMESLANHEITPVSMRLPKFFNNWSSVCPRVVRMRPFFVFTGQDAPQVHLELIKPTPATGRVSTDCMTTYFVQGNTKSKRIVGNKEVAEKQRGKTVERFHLTLIRAAVDLNTKEEGIFYGGRRKMKSDECKTFEEFFANIQRYTLANVDIETDEKQSFDVIVHTCTITDLKELEKVRGADQVWAEHSFTEDGRTGQFVPPEQQIPCESYVRQMAMEQYAWTPIFINHQGVRGRLCARPIVRRKVSEEDSAAKRKYPEEEEEKDATTTVEIDMATGKIVFKSKTPQLHPWFQSTPQNCSRMAQLLHVLADVSKDYKMKLLNDIMLSATTTPLAVPDIADLDLTAIMQQPNISLPSIPMPQMPQSNIPVPQSQIISQQVLSQGNFSPAGTPNVSSLHSTGVPSVQPAVQPPMHLINNFSNYQENDVVYN